MTRDRRGFHYALEAVRSMTAWDIDGIAAELAPLNTAVAAQESRVAALAAGLAAARQAVVAQRQAEARLDISAQRLAHGYLLQAQGRLRHEQQQLRAMTAQRDAVYARLLEARKFADSLERDKESALDEHDRNTAKRSYQESDDNWLQRLHWRNSQ